MPDGVIANLVPETIQATPVTKRPKKLSKTEKWHLEWERKYGWKYEAAKTETSGDYGKDCAVGDAIACRFLANMKRGSSFDSHAISDIMLSFGHLDPSVIKSRQGIIVGFGSMIGGVLSQFLSRVPDERLDELAAEYDQRAASYEAREQERCRHEREERKALQSIAAKRGWATRRVREAQS